MTAAPPGRPKLPNRLSQGVLHIYLDVPECRNSLDEILLVPRRRRTERREPDWAWACEANAGVRTSETQTCNGPKSPSRVRCWYSPNPVPRCRASLLNTTLPRGQAVHLGANMQRSNTQDYQ